MIYQGLRLSRYSAGLLRNRHGTHRLTSIHFATWPRLYPKRIRVITCDITGTLLSFRGSLEHHYLGSAESSGVDLSRWQKEADLMSINDAFAQAYKECTDWYPCFGGTTMSAKEWWKICVLRSFELAGVPMNDSQQEAVFQRIYSVFGSQECYEKFDDAMPFLNWIRRNKVLCGVLSNADERYGDSILPMLGFPYLQLQCFSKDVGYEKPDPRFFQAALTKAKHHLGNDERDPLLPSQVLHIGNDYRKDFEGARRVGWHAILLSRYNEPELASEWKRRGALVFEDLLDVVEMLGRAGCKLG